LLRTPGTMLAALLATAAAVATRWLQRTRSCSAHAVQRVRAALAAEPAAEPRWGRKA
jgi:hypothetical protein